MIKKIRSSLSVKVFVLTAVLMVVCCTVTYLCIARFSPYIYTHRLEDAEELARLAYLELPNYNFSESELNYDIQLYNETLKMQFDDEFVFYILPSDSAELRSFDGVDTTTRYSFRFADSDVEYTVFIAKNMEKESQITEALQKAIPVLSVVILAVSIVASFFYTVYMTTPVKQISKISKQMAALNFSGLCEVRRTDEIGTLSSSLNELSEKLSSALSELQNANKQLQADIDKERELERQRIDFFSAASHELKTPITIIKGQLQGMLCNIGRYKDHQTYLAESLEVTNTLEQMVQELLTVSRLETPGYICTKSRFDFSQLVEARLAAFDDLFAQKELTLEKSLLSETYLLGDAQLLQKALDNLIHNAITYSPVQNKVAVRLWMEQDKVCFSVENTGVHIPDEAIPKLFEAFYRVDTSRNRRTGGSGLGLYIVKTILDLHGAEIEMVNTLQGVLTKVSF
ncbi:MAG: HAMP domain-containing sensor histidine kinase [Eubacteriales bacterium]|nr:HAMP domain-containing sensor histidine kinase [Eubacteriales bacterium]